MSLRVIDKGVNISYNSEHLFCDINYLYMSLARFANQNDPTLTRVGFRSSRLLDKFQVVILI